MATEKQARNGGIDQPNNDQSRTEPDFLAIQINEVPKIGKVPAILRQNKDHEDMFRPLLLVLGPYHHGKHGEEQLLNYKRGEELKSQLMRKFYMGKAEWSYQPDYENVVALTSEAKKWYSEDSTKVMNDDDQFAKMMFRDGCAILQFITCAVNGDWSGMNIKNYEIALIISDLFLLENQVPSFVLKELIKGTKNNIKKMFEKFIETTRQVPEIQASCLANIADFFYNLRRNGKKKEEKSNQNEEDDEPLHLLDSLWKYYVPSKEISKTKEDAAAAAADTRGDWCTFRSAKELKAAGILFSVSKTQRFTEVKYKALLLHISFLCLPPIVVDDSTKSLLLNLASYEMSSYPRMINVVSSYICFMDSLIDNKEDVAELRRQRIILNNLGSDEMVATLFNDVATHLVPHASVYQGVKEKIEEHYKNKIKTWMTECLYTHFRTPWTFLAFIAAVYVSW